MLSANTADRDQGFSMEFSNGWMISVRFSPDHSCSARFVKDQKLDWMGRWTSDTAEVGIFRVNLPSRKGKGAWLTSFGDGGVKGHCGADEVSELIAMTASLPNGLMTDDGQMIDVFAPKAV